MEAYWYYLDVLAKDNQIVSRVDIGDHLFEKKPTLPKVDVSQVYICREGDQLNAQQIAKIRACVDYRDIESLFSPKFSLNSRWLKQLLFSYLRQDPSLEQFYDSSKNSLIVDEVCFFFEAVPEILFRVYVLSRTAPEILERSFFCFWLAVFLGFYTGRDGEFNHRLLIACLCHDLGLLDIDIALTTPSQGSGQYKYAYYEHTTLGANFIKSAGVEDNEIYKAICQHHEYIDGTGLPNHLIGVRLSEIGQLINMFDSLYLAYNSTFMPIGRGITDLVPIIEMNSVTRFGFSAKSLIELLETGEKLPIPSLPLDTLHALRQLVQNLFASVDQASKVIQTFTNTVGFRHDDKALSALQNGFFHIVLVIHKSEKISPEYLSELQNMNDSALLENGRELEDLSLMLKEVFFHISEFKYRLSVYASTCNNEAVKNEAEKTLAQLDDKVLTLENDYV